MSRGLYTSSELLAGFDPQNPLSFISTADFRIYLAFLAAGGPAPADAAEESRQAEHDVQIGRALRSFLSAFRDGNEVPRLVGIMGGHGVPRDDPAYHAMADLARTLARADFLVISGGGPGLMEAAHFGALFADSTDGSFENARQRLASDRGPPDSLQFNKKDGSLAPGQEASIGRITAWLNSALEARALLDGPERENLAIPTWLYGTEPTTPFATAYAKYFRNSLREEELVTSGRAGVVFGQGGGGTIQEIFQDMAGNYYAKPASSFSPMIFFDPNDYWTTSTSYSSDGRRTAKGVDLRAVVGTMIDTAFPDPGDRASCRSKVAFTVDDQAIVDLLTQYAPQAQQRLSLALQGAGLAVLSPQYLK